MSNYEMFITVALITIFMLSWNNALESQEQDRLMGAE